MLDLVALGMDLYRERIAESGRDPAVFTGKLGSTPSRTVMTSNKMKLVVYERETPAQYAEPLLLVPSLINRAYIMDLLPKFSLVRYLLEQGFKVYLVDWGVPTDEDRFIDFDSLIEPYLDRAVRATLKDSGEKKLSFVGYCMGATLGAIYNSLHPELIANFVNLLGPMDFSKAGMLTDWTRKERFNPEHLIGAYGNVPPALMQSSFQGMRPTSQIMKQLKGPTGPTDEELKEFFDALEYWAWDNIPFPGTAYKKYIKELYQENRLLSGELRIHGKKADPKAITSPVLVLTADKDHIVPTASAQALEGCIGCKDKMTVTVRGGHVAAVVGPMARTQLWPQMSDWLSMRSTPVGE